MSIKAYRFHLRTNPGTEAKLRRFTGACRWTWNAAIAEQRRREAGEKFAGYAAMCEWLTAWRNAPQTAWLAHTPIHPLQQTLRQLEAAYRRFFEGAGGDRCRPANSTPSGVVTRSCLVFASPVPLPCRDIRPCVLA